MHNRCVWLRLARALYDGRLRLTRDTEAGRKRRSQKSDQDETGAEEDEEDVAQHGFMNYAQRVPTAQQTNY